MMRFRKRVLAVVLAGLLAATFAGCGKDETPPVEPDRLTNDGRSAVIVLGELETSPEKTAVLEEIARKYRADFPNTEIEIRTFPGEPEMRQALENGELDVAEVHSRDQRDYIRSGLLTDVGYYVSLWDERLTLIEPVKSAVSCMGGGHTYLIPNDFLQDLMIYRKDRFEAYNEGLEKGTAQCRLWDQISGGDIAGETVTGAVKKLGENGGLVLAGKDKLLTLYDNILWSALSRDRIIDVSAGYFSAVQGHTTVFTLDKAKEGADSFLRVINDALVPESLEWTREQAVEYFCQGKASMLWADRTVFSRIAESLPKDSWSVETTPRGRAGCSIVSGEFTGWGVSSACEDPKFVMHFLTYLSNSDNNTHYALKCGTFPLHVFSADMEPLLLETDLVWQLDMAQISDWYRYAFEPMQFEAYEGYPEQADEKLRAFAAGEIGKDELLSWLDQYWMEAYRQEGELWLPEKDRNK